MPDYKNGKIYTIRSPHTEKIYIGSTTQPLHVRLGGHKRFNCNSKLLFEASNNVKIELIEEYACNNKMELTKKEGEYIRNTKCLNKEIAGRTKKEWREDNKEYVKERIKKWSEDNKEHVKKLQKEWREDNKEHLIEKGKKWYEKNKERRKEKITCDCGCIINRCCLVRHKKSNKHLELIKLN